MHGFMPTVLRFDGLNVRLYSGDHRPAHVHVIGAEVQTVFVLNCPDGPPKIRECYGFSRPEARRIGTDLRAFVPELCESLRRIHG